MKKPILLITSMLAASILSHADMASFSATADTSISERDADNNFGGATYVSSGRDGNLGGNPRRALFQFDLGSIPPGSTIQSATLKLVVVKTPGFGAVNSSFGIHRLTAGWIEGTKSGNNGLPASLGEATWNNRAHGIAPWSGGASAAGDFAVGSSAAVPVAGNGLYSWSSAGLASDVQGWVDHPDQNFGWLAVSESEAANKTARGLGSRENPTPANRPVLEVEFLPPPPPQGIAMESLVIGGYVYRGSAYPGLAGKYVFGDFSTGFGAPDGKLYYLSETQSGLWQRFEFSIQPGGGPLGRYVKGFGEGEDGEIYLLSDSGLGPSGAGGDVRRLVEP